MMLQITILKTEDCIFGRHYLMVANHLKDGRIIMKPAILEGQVGPSGTWAEVKIEEAK